MSEMTNAELRENDAEFLRRVANELFATHGIDERGAYRRVVNLSEAAHSRMIAIATRLASRSTDGRDTERLDWWESQRTRTLAPVMAAEGWRLHEPDLLRPLSVPFAKSLRQAIDYAAARFGQDGKS